MNIIALEYEKFITTKESLQNRLKDFWTFWCSINNWSENDFTIRDSAFNLNSIVIQWEWFGSYQSKDWGIIDVPTNIFLDKELWKQFIHEVIQKEKDKIRDEQKAMEEESKQEDLMLAKRILQKHGLTSLDMMNI